MLLGVTKQCGQDQLLRILAQRHMDGRAYGNLRYNCKEFNRSVFDSEGVFVSTADFEGELRLRCDVN